jgi:ribosomal protein S18 acetylase RimI-like enzyme
VAPSFRAADPADIERLIPLVRELYALEKITFDEDASRTALVQLLEEPRYGRVWVIEQRDVTVGNLVLTYDSSLEYGRRTAYIDELYVREAYRRRRIATQALELAEAACRQQGRRALHLEVDRTNSAAQAAYRRAGFVDHDRYLMTNWLDLAQGATSSQLEAPPRTRPTVRTPDEILSAVSAASGGNCCMLSPQYGGDLGRVRSVAMYLPRR